MGDVVRLPAVSLLVQDELFAVPAAGLRAIGVPAPLPDKSRVKRNTKKTGDISEARVLAALVEAGYDVSRPFGENQRYDLIIDDGTTLSRVQVKTGRLRGGVIKFSCCSSHAHRGAATRPYFSQIELLAVYCPQTRKIYLVPESALVATYTHLRIAPTKNGQAKAIRWASQYELP